MTRRRFLDARGNLHHPYAPSSTYRFSWMRCIVVSLFCISIFITNPANDPYILPSLSKTTIPSSSPPRSRHRFAGGFVTNYLFFCLGKDKYNMLEIYGLGHVFQCRYDDYNIGFLCQGLRDGLAHQKPLIFDPLDRAYSAYRIISWVLVVGTIVSLWFDNPSKLESTPILSTFLPHLQRPIDSAIESLFEWSVVGYPAMQQMSQLIPIQAEKSIFRIHKNEDVNFWIAYTVFLLAAVLCNHLSQYCTRQYLMSQAITAVALGYYRGTTDPQMDWLWLVVLKYRVSAVALTWMIFAFRLSRSFSLGLAWIGSNALGFLIGRYHLELTIVFVFARDIRSYIEETIGAFFGY